MANVQDETCQCQFMSVEFAICTSLGDAEVMQKCNLTRRIICCFLCGSENYDAKTHIKAENYFEIFYNDNNFTIFNYDGARVDSMIVEDVEYTIVKEQLDENNKNDFCTLGTWQTITHHVPFRENLDLGFAVRQNLWIYYNDDNYRGTHHYIMPLMSLKPAKNK